MDPSEILQPGNIALMVIFSIIALVCLFFFWKAIKTILGIGSKVDPQMKQLAIAALTSVCDAFHQRQSDLIKGISGSARSDLIKRIQEYKQLHTESDTRLDISLSKKPYVTILKNKDQYLLLSVAGFKARFMQEPATEKSFQPGLNKDFQHGVFVVKIDKTTRQVTGIKEDLWGEKYGDI